MRSQLYKIRFYNIKQCTSKLCIKPQRPACRHAAHLDHHHHHHHPQRHPQRHRSQRCLERERLQVQPVYRVV